MPRLTKITAVALLGGVLYFAADGRAADADPRAAYNQGVDLYSRGDYNKAAESFQRALNTDRRRIEAWTNYNLGNARYEQAQAAAQQPAAGVASLKEALLFFRRALEIDPRDQNAKYNYELTQQLLKQLEQQAQQQQQEQKQEQNQEQKKEQQPEQNKVSPAGQTQNKQQDTSAAKNTDAAGEQKDQAAPQHVEDPGEDRKEPNSAAAQGGTGEQQKMTPQEAQMLLDNFQRQEKMSQQVVTPEQRRDEAPIGKDW